MLNHFYPTSHLFVLQNLVIRDSSTSLQTHHMDSTLKQCGKHRFHIVSTWNPRNLFCRVFSQSWHKSQPPHTKSESILPSTGNQNTALNMTKYEFLLTRVFLTANSVLTRENPGQWKPAFSHILCSERVYIGYQISLEW